MLVIKYNIVLYYCTAYIALKPKKMRKIIIFVNYKNVLEVTCSSLKRVVNADTDIIDGGGDRKKKKLFMK